jgi:hypothetical protein
VNLVCKLFKVFFCVYCRYWKPFLFTGTLKLVNTLVQFTPALFLGRILKYVGQASPIFTDQESSKNVVFSLAEILRIDSFETFLILLTFWRAAVFSSINGFFRNKGVKLSLLLFLSLCAKTAIENQYFHEIVVLSSEIRGTLSAAVYRKALKLSPESRRNNTVR